MKIIFNKETMCRAIAFSQEVIANKSPMSILSNVLLETKENKLVIKATDSTVKFTMVIPVEVEEDGIITIFCDKFMSILSSLPSGDVELTQGDDGIVIKPLAKKVKFKMKMLATDKFPEFNDVKAETLFEVSCKDVKELISNTIFAISTDRNRFFMTGVFLKAKDKDLIAVGTDGRRMSLSQKISPADFDGVIIPPKVLNILMKLLSDEGSVSIEISNKMILFAANNFVLSTTLIDGQYPNYERVIPTNLEQNMIISKKDLEDAIKRIKVMSNPDGRLSFSFNRNEAAILAPDTEIGSATETISCKSTVDKAELHINVQYLTDILKVINSCDIEFCFNADLNGKITKAVIVKGNNDNKNNIHIIMPMQI